MNQSLTKSQLIAVFGIFAAVLTVVALAVILLNTPIYIRNMGTSVEQNGAIVNTITVAGDGRVTVTPDMATITFTVSEIADTSAIALQQVNERMNQVLGILKANSIEDKDIQTSQFNIYPEYDYSVNGGSKIKGQRASIGVTVKIKALDEKASKATKIIDEVSVVEKVQMGSISFDLENKEEAYNQARELAYNKAKQKADELSRLSGVRLLKPVSITDYSVNTGVVAPVTYNAEGSSFDSVKSTSLSTGELELSINLNVIFGIE